MLTHRCWRGWDRGVSLGQDGRNWGHTCMAGKGPAWRPDPPSRETLMGTLSGRRGGGVGAGLGRAVLLQITRSETRQDRNLGLA